MIAEGRYVNLSIATLCDSSAASRALQKNGDQALGRSRGGLSTKIHALVEGLGSLARFRLTGGEAGDSPEALPLLQHLNPGSVPSVTITAKLRSRFAEVIGHDGAKYARTATNLRITRPCNKLLINYY